MTLVERIAPVFAKLCRTIRDVGLSGKGGHRNSAKAEHTRNSFLVYFLKLGRTARNVSQIFIPRSLRSLAPY
jgi:hypothetical protein